MPSSGLALRRSIPALPFPWLVRLRAYMDPMSTASVLPLYHNTLHYMAWHGMASHRIASRAQDSMSRHIPCRPAGTCKHVRHAATPVIAITHTSLHIHLHIPHSAYHAKRKQTRRSIPHSLKCLKFFVFVI